MLILFYELFHISSTKGKNFIFEWLLELMEHSSKWLYFPPWFSPVWAISCLFVLFGIEKILCHNICTYWFNFEFLFLIFFYELSSNISQISGFTILQTWCLYQNKVVYFVFYSSSMISSMGALQVGHGSPILKVSLHFLQYWEW